MGIVARRSAFSVAIYKRGIQMELLELREVNKVFNI